MSYLNLPPLKSVSALATDKPLSDPSLPSSPVSLGLSAQSTTVNLALPTNAESKLGSFVISGGPNTSVAIINSNHDPDPIGYFNLGVDAQPTAENPSNGPIPESPIDYDPALAYVVITGLSVTGKLSGNFSIGHPNTLGLTGTSELDASACMAFPRDAMTWAAVAVAAANFRTVFSIDELLPSTPPRQNLATRQVLSFGVQTNLNLSLTLAASSLASTVAESANEVLNRSGPFNFSVGPSATVILTAGATDGFRVFSQRTPVGGTLFSVKKSAATRLGLNSGAGLVVGMSDTALNDLINSVFDQLSGAAAGTVQSIVGSDAASGSDLPPPGQRALQQIVSELRLSSTVCGDLQSLQAKLASFKRDLSNRLSLVASAQFSYSWQRLTSQSLVAQFTVPDAALPKYHADILSLDLTRLMTEGAADGVVFSRILGQNTREVDIGYGFSFGIAGYTFLKSWDSLKEKFVELDSSGAGGTLLRRYSFLGKRASEVSWMGTSQLSYVELDAIMASPSAAPDAGDFQAGLSVAFSWKNIGFERLVTTVADHGALIGAFATDDAAAASQSLVASGLPLDATGDALVSLTLSDAVLRQMLPTLSGQDYRARIAPYAMARALPFNDSYPERSRVDLRTEVYGQVFAYFLAMDSGDLAPDTVAKLCARFLSGANRSTGLAAAEGQQPFAWTAQGVVTMASQGDLQDAVVNKAPRCFSLLQTRAGDFRAVFPTCVSDFSGLAEQAYGSRVLAGMLYLAATVNPGWLDRVSRSVSFTWKDSTGSHVVISKQGSRS